jgi:hypothetical protein
LETRDESLVGKKCADCCNNTIALQLRHRFLKNGSQARLCSLLETSRRFSQDCCSAGLAAVSRAYHHVYAPAVGAFSIWLGVIAIASTDATLRLEAAMILDHDSIDQQTCFSVVAYSATALALAITLCALIARAGGIPQAQNMSWFGLMTIGVGTWLTAYNQTVIAYATSYRAFGKAALAKVCGAGTVALGQVILLLIGVSGTARQGIYSASPWPDGNFPAVPPRAGAIKPLSRS